MSVNISQCQGHKRGCIVTLMLFILHIANTQNIVYLVFAHQFLYVFIVKLHVDNNNLYTFWVEYYDFILYKHRKKLNPLSFIKVTF